MARRSKRRRSPLRSRIESETVELVEIPANSKVDTVDPAILDHVNAFIADFQNAPKLEKINLLDPEEARYAVGMLKRTKDEIDRKLRTAKLLKGLLQQQ